MQFQLNKSQKEIQKAAHEFAKGEFEKDLAYDLDKSGDFPSDIWKNAAELGFIGIHFPEEYVGGGLGTFENALVAEAFCSKDSTIGSALMLSGFASECLLRFGSDEQKRAYLPEIAEGKILSGAAFAEPGNDYVFNAINTHAARADDGWIISGKKTHVVNYGKAGFYCLLCRITSQNNSTNSIGMILLEADRSGVSLVHRNDKLGMRMTSTAEIRLDGVRVPHSNLIGRENRGNHQVDAFLTESRILISAMALGTAQGALNRAQAYVKQREQFGKKIALFQVSRHKLADMALQIVQARFMTYAAAREFDQGKPDTTLAAMAKLVATRAAIAVTNEAIQLMGGYGYMTEYEVERFYRDAKTMETFCGNSGCLKDGIANSVIGRVKK